MIKEEIEHLIHILAEYMYKIGYEDGISKHIEKVNEATYETGVARGREQAWECARKIRGLYQGELCGVFPYDEKNDRGDYDDFCTDWLYDYSASEAIQKIKEWEEKQQAEKSCKTCRYDYEICTPKYIDLRCWQSKQTDDEVKEQEYEEKQNEQIKKTCENCKWKDYSMIEQPCADCNLGAEVWEPDQIYNEIKVGDVVEVDGFTGLSRLLIVITVTKGAQIIRVMNAYGDNECVDASSVKKTGRSFPEIAKAMEQIQKEVEQLEKEYMNCMNCGHMHPHYDTFKK